MDNIRLNSKLKKQYSVLGGVVAPKSSAFAIQGMPNPLAEKPTKKIDTTLPSLRDTGSVSTFNSFNPYGRMPVKSRELKTNRVAMRHRKSDMKLTNVVNRFEGSNSPILPKKYIRQY
tara:strand:+ start:2414 stop:2764 length:351 start_codon:yes stop_codon:yes gene_type:complete